MISNKPPSDTWFAFAILIISGLMIVNYWLYRLADEIASANLFMLTAIVALVISVLFMLPRKK